VGGARQQTIAAPDEPIAPPVHATNLEADTPKGDATLTRLAGRGDASCSSGCVVDTGQAYLVGRWVLVRSGRGVVPVGPEEAPPPSCLAHARHCGFVSRFARCSARGPRECRRWRLRDTNGTPGRGPKARQNTGNVPRSPYEGICGWLLSAVGHEGLDRVVWRSTSDLLYLERKT